MIFSVWSEFTLSTFLVIVKMNVEDKALKYKYLVLLDEKDNSIIPDERKNERIEERTK